MSDQNRVSSRRCIEASTSNSTCFFRDKYSRSSPLHRIVRTLPASIKRAHVEDINTLHLSKNFETLKTSSLLEIGGHGTRLGTLGEKVGLGSDLCSARRGVVSQNISSQIGAPGHIRVRHLPQSNGAPTTPPSAIREVNVAYGRKA